jgi:hypothetical protein
MTFETKDMQNNYPSTATEEKVVWGNTYKGRSARFRNVQLIKANDLIGIIVVEGRAPWMVLIGCLQKYCQVHHCIILYVLQCATGFCKIVFKFDMLD